MEGSVSVITLTTFPKTDCKKTRSESRVFEIWEGRGEPSDFTSCAAPRDSGSWRALSPSWNHTPCLGCELAMGLITLNADLAWVFECHGQIAICWPLTQNAHSGHSPWRLLKSTQITEMYLGAFSTCEWCWLSASCTGDNIGWRHGRLNRTCYGVSHAPPHPNSCVEPSTPNATIFRDRAFKDVFTAKWGPRGELSSNKT